MLLAAVAWLPVVAREQRAAALLPSVNRTELVSVADDESLGNAWSGSNGDAWGWEFGENSISGDGSLVVFTSRASNLVGDDTNGKADVFVRDRALGTTERVSLTSAGVQFGVDAGTGAISDDGRYVAFAAGASGPAWPALYLRDRELGTTTTITGTGMNPQVSGDGSYVVYTGSGSQVYRWDRGSGTAELASVAIGGGPPNGLSGAGSISSDGTHVAFATDASNVVTGDTNGAYDVFVRDMTGGVTERVSVDTTEQQWPGWSGASSLSADGSVVAFLTYREHLFPGTSDPQGAIVMVRDRIAGTTELASRNTIGQVAADNSNSPSISDDGRFISFYTLSYNMTAYDRARGDTYVYDRVLRATTMMSLTSGGLLADGESLQGSSISADGRFVVFESTSTRLVAGDTNGVSDVFVRDRAGELGDLIPPIDTIIEGPDLELPFQPNLAIDSTWRARDTLSGIAAFDVAVRRARYDQRSLGSASLWRNRTLTRRGLFDARAGYTYCFRLRALDNRRNQSGWGPQRCTTTPVDDRRLERSSSWVKGTASGYYGKTFLRSSIRGARLTLPVSGKRLVLVARRCSSCGVIEAFLDGKLLRRIDTSGSGALQRRWRIARFDRVRSGTLTLRIVSSGRPVSVDGIGVGLV